MYTEESWNNWVKKELKNYRESTNIKTGRQKRHYVKKGYLHFDARYWFPSHIDEHKLFISKPSNIIKRSFYPFLKIVHKTPRYQIDENKKQRVLKRKQRPICYASHFDALLYGYYSYRLTEIYESFIAKQGLQDVVLAYRTDLSKCNIDFAKTIFDYIKNTGECTALALDIKGFFDHLNHEKLLQNWTTVLDNGSTKLPDDQYKIFKSLTHYSYVNRNTLLSNIDIQLSKLSVQPKTLLDLIPGKRDFEKFNYLRKKNIITTNRNCYGIPQGSPMSAVLSNIYMIEYDKQMLDLAKKHNCLYQRYCDDILFICRTQDSQLIKDEAYKQINKFKLIIQEKKEEQIVFQKNSQGQIRSFDGKKLKECHASLNFPDESKFYKPLQYLGFEYNGNNIVIRSSSMSRYMRKMKARSSKTVKMAYSRTGKGNRILKRKLLHRYTHLGKRNFISYALNAAKKSYKTADGSYKTGVDSLAIKNQISRHYDILLQDLDRKNRKRVLYKSKVGKLQRVKKI